MPLTSRKIPKDKVPELLAFFKEQESNTILEKTKSQYEEFRLKYKGNLVIGYKSGSISFEEQPFIVKTINDFLEVKNIHKTSLIKKTTEKTTPTSIDLGKKNIDKFTKFMDDLKAEPHETTTPYMHSRYKHGNLNYILYTSGKLVYDRNQQSEKLLNDFYSALEDDKGEIIIGQDEVGKGEWFGSVMIASVALTEHQSKILRIQGVKDSKQLSEKEISRLVPIIKGNCISYKVVTISSDKFNKLFNDFKEENKSLNSLLAWGHQRALKNLINDVYEKNIEIAGSKVFIDEFDRIRTDERLATIIADNSIILKQKHKADELITAVSAASVLAKHARDEAINKIHNQFRISFKIANPVEFLLHPNSHDLVKVKYLETMNLKAGKILGAIKGIFVGVNDYRDKKPLLSLDYAVNDAISIYKRFINLINTDQKNTMLLIDKDCEDETITNFIQQQEYTDPTKSNMIDQLDKIITKTEKNDIFIFYFAGHGFQDKKGKDFLLPKDVVMSSLDETAISLEMIFEKIEKIPANRKVIILDSCRFQSLKARSTEGILFGKNVLDEAEKSRVFTLISCRPEEVSYEWKAKKHGVFTYFLLEGLDGEAADSSGRITVKSLSEYAKKQVITTTQEMGWNQNPQTKVTGVDIDLSTIPDIFLKWIDPIIPL